MSNAFIVRPLPFNSLTCDSQAAGAPVSNLGNDYIGVVHRTISTAGGNAIGYFATAQMIDCIALLSLAIDPAARWRASWGGFDLPFELLYPAGSILPVSGRGHALCEAPAAVSAASIVTQTDTLDGLPFEAGRLVAGRKIQLARNFVFGGGRGIMDTGTLDWSITGTPLRRYGKRLRTVRISFENAYKDEVEASILPLLETIGTTDPIMLVLDSAAGPQRMNRIYYGWLRGTQEIIQRTANGWRFSCELVSVI